MFNSGTGGIFILPALPVIICTAKFTSGRKTGAKQASSKHCRKCAFDNGCRIACYRAATAIVFNATEGFPTITKLCIALLQYRFFKFILVFISFFCIDKYKYKF
jgi:hypothetical protein